jgi:WD40 repeat protein
MLNSIRPISNKTRGGVFISYARSDGEDFAQRLRAKLEKDGISLWQDRVGLEGGRDWWLQIVEALTHVEFMALVVTPNALNSEVIRKEWRYARQQGVCVYPVKGAPDLDFSSMPRWIHTSHFYDIDREWPKFSNDLNTRCQTPRVPFMVEDMPDDFVPRPKEFEQLIDHLLDEQRETPIAITAALRGAGGYGKTTLARALCHHEPIQDAFDDGILWVTLGEKPGELTGYVQDLIYALNGERLTFSSIEAASTSLADLLADRDILIVIDDVWNVAHIKPFMQGGSRCARLITTRNIDTLPSKAKQVSVDAMQQGEAVTLLSAGLPNIDHGPLRQLAAKLGEWPLLLKLANGTLAHRIYTYGQDPAAVLSYVDKALDKRGVTFFDARDAKSRDQAVSKTLSISFELLSVGERERYSELAIFPEDVHIPLPTVERLWKGTGGYDEFDTEELCDRLSRLSLLLLFSPTARYIRLHDVVRSYLIREQGDNLLLIHNHLLDAHRPSIDKDDTCSRPFSWADMPAEEPYLWDYLAYHLVKGNRVDELIREVKNLRYVVNKTLLRKASAVEADLYTAELYALDDILSPLRRNFIQSSHILNRCETIEEAETTLYSRLQHIELLKPLLQVFESTLSRPYIAPWHPLPDLPSPSLIRTISGHKSSVNRCAISPDGTFIVSASSDGTLRVWDARSGTERLNLSNQRGATWCCAVSPDNSFIISGSADRTLKIWDAQTGVEIRTLFGHTDRVNRCVVSPDGSLIISASSDMTLRVWDAKTGDNLLVLTDHKDNVNDCAVSPDGSFIVSASSDGTVVVWDIKSGKVLHSFRKSSEEFTCCAISPDGSFIVAGSSDRTLSIWTVKTRKHRRLTAHRAPINCCAISPDGSLVVSASADNMIKVWDVKTGTNRNIHNHHRGRVNCCAFSPDGSFIVSGSSDQTLILWDAKYGSEQGVIRVEYLDSGLISPDGSLVASTTLGGAIEVWNSNNGNHLYSLPSHGMRLKGMAFNLDCSLLTSLSSDNTIAVWDTRTRTKRFTIHVNEDSEVSFALSPNGSFIASAHSERMLKIWDTKNGECISSLHTEGQLNGCLWFSDSRRLLAFGESGAYFLRLVC